jgi:23S rRNA (guanine745-N1)-methyltransferase
LLGGEWTVHISNHRTSHIANHKSNRKSAIANRNWQPPLACTVRACGLLLERAARSFRCARGHTYDVARSGYINLLQPQDRKSTRAGDALDAIEARARLLELSVGRTILDAVIDRAATYASRDAVVVDLGSGGGELLGLLGRQMPATTVGIDLSTAAAEFASRRFPHVCWVVANADRFLPILDRSADVLVSVHGRRNAPECARALSAGGELIIVVPAADDLIELREVVQGAGIARDRGDRVIDEHDALFALRDRKTVRERHQLAAEPLRDLLRATYRGRRRAASERIESLETLTVTVASEILTFTRRKAG